MSNERIDLTQFEGITEGPWFIDIEDKPMRLRKVWTDEDDAKHSIPDYDLDKFDVAIVEHISPEAGFTISKPDFRGIEMVPELIAELKRCYEEIDELKELCHEFLGQALTLYDVGNQHKDVDYDYREFNKLRTRFAELLDFKSASE